MCIEDDTYFVTRAKIQRARYSATFFAKEFYDLHQKKGALLLRSWSSPINPILALCVYTIK